MKNLCNFNIFIYSYWLHWDVVCLSIGPIWTHFERPGGTQSLPRGGCGSVVSTRKINANLGWLLSLQIIRPGQYEEAQGLKYNEKTIVFLTFAFLHIGSIGTLFVRPLGPSGIISSALGGLKIFHGGTADQSFRHEKSMRTWDDYSASK